jgi:HAD superfamily hydrolase (TIGR01549 family)
LIDAVIFDLDGTLVDLPINYDRLYQEMSKILKKKTVRPLLKTVKEANLAERKQIFKAWDKLELEALPKTLQNTEGMDIYREYCCKTKALVTMQGKDAATEISRRFGLSFVFSVTRELSLDRKQQLEIAAEKLGKNVHNIVFVGNEDHDEKAAEELGCQFRRVRPRKSGTTLLQENT